MDRRRQVYSASVDQQHVALEPSDDLRAQLQAVTRDAAAFVQYDLLGAADGRAERILTSAGQSKIISFNLVCKQRQICLLHRVSRRLETRRRDRHAKRTAAA